MIKILNRTLALVGVKDLRLTNDHVAQLSWLGWGQIISLVLSLVSIKLTTSIGPVGYGQFVLITSLGGLLSLSFFGPLEQGFVRYYFEFSKSEEQKSAYLRIVFNTLKIAAGILCLIGIVAVVIGIIFFQKTVLFMVSASVLIIISVISTPIAGLFNAMKLRREISIIQVLEKVFIVAFLLLAAATMALDLTFVMVAITSSMAIFLVVRIWIYLKQINVRSSKESINHLKSESGKKIIVYCLPFIFWGWLSWFQFNGERWVVNGFLTMTDVGKYGLSASIVNNSVVLAYGVFIQFLTPSIYDKFSTGNNAEKKKGYGLIKTASLLTFVLFCAFGVLLYVGGEQIIHLLSTKEYVIDALLLFLLTVGLGIFYVGQTLALVGFALQKPSAYIIPKIVSAILSMAGYIIGCMWIGLFGIVISILVSNVVYLVSVMLINRKLLFTQPV